MLICILTKNVITSCSVTMMLFLHLEVKPLMTLTTVLYLSCALDRKSGSAGMPRPISYAVFCLKKKKDSELRAAERTNTRWLAQHVNSAVGADIVLPSIAA